MFSAFCILSTDSEYSNEKGKPLPSWKPHLKEVVGGERDGRRKGGGRKGRREKEHRLYRAIL